VELLLRKANVAATGPWLASAVVEALRVTAIVTVINLVAASVVTGTPLRS
jgi:hypothetical protein